MKKISINQPTFMPWLGWFELLDNTDVFVLLDDVQFSKQSWQQRNRIKTSKGSEFITLSVKKNSNKEKINDVKLTNFKYDLKKMIKTIETNYNKTKHYEKLIKELMILFDKISDSKKLIDVNLNLIIFFNKILGINKKIYFSSNLPFSLNKTNYIIEICKFFKIDNYVSPYGARDYLLNDIDKFKKNNIKIFLQNFKTPLYSQCFGCFEENLSIIDLLFNEGPNSLNIIRSGRNELINFL